MSEAIFKDLSVAKIISLDVETKDPGLEDLGPSTFRGGGYVCGISLATDDGWAQYFPVRHEAGGNLDPAKVYSYLRDQLKGPQPKLGANIAYDLEWLRAEGVRVKGPKWDVQTAEALLDENRDTYRLDALGQSYLGEHKDEAGMLDAALKRGIPEKKYKENIWRLHADEVAAYGRQDVLLPLKVFELQRKKLVQEELWPVFELEARLIDALLDMRFKGVRVDLAKAELAAAALDRRKGLLEDGLVSLCGRAVDYWSNQDLAKACDQLGIVYKRTGNHKTDARGNPSFEAEWLVEQGHPFLKQVAACRRLDRAGSVFIRSKVIGLAVNGRVHAQFYPVRSDRGGARSGRFASANPNMQQVPARDEELAPIVRGCFIPEDGCEWFSFDWSQIEPRLTVHYAFILGMRGAKEAHDRYVNDPDTDYHQLTADMAEIERTPAKTINLGLSYGMGKVKLAKKLGLSLEEAGRLSDRYHLALPYVKLLGNKCTRLAEARGYVKTILGRRRRFELFGPARYSDGVLPLPREAAIAKYGPCVRRYFTHKAMNAVIQGSAAELMKVLLVHLYDLGITPHITVHDDVSESCETREKARQIKEAMEAYMQDYFKLTVPLKADVEAGPSWGEAEEVML